MYGEVKIVGRAMPMPLGCELGVKASGVAEGDLVYEMDEPVSAEDKMYICSEQICVKNS